MPKHRYLLKGPDPDELKQRAVREYGGAVRFIQCEKVTQSGIAGLLAGPRYELIVEIFEEDRPDTQPLPVLGGIVNLLVDPPAPEGKLAEKPELPPVSTASGEFDTLLKDLDSGIGSERAAGKRRGKTTRKDVAG